MSDNTVLSTNVGSGDTLRDKDRSGVKTQIVGLDLNPAGGSEVLCAAAALADATANPSTLLVGACLEGWNGTTWDRLKSTTANGLAVDVTRVQGSVAVTGTFWQATQPVSGTVTANIGTGNLAGITGNVTVVGTGTFAAQAAQSGTWTVQPGNTPNTSPWLTTQTPAASGGCSTYSYIAAASANQDSQSVKGSAGQLYGYDVFNTTASIRYVKLYNKATAPTSSDTPVRRIMVPANGGAVRDIVNGAAFSLGIGIRITTGSADADTGAATAGDVIVNLDYK